MIRIPDPTLERNYIQSVDCSSQLQSTRYPATLTLYSCTQVRTGCQIGSGPGGIRVEALTNQNGGAVYRELFNRFNPTTLKHCNRVWTAVP